MGWVRVCMWKQKVVSQYILCHRLCFLSFLAAAADGETSSGLVTQCEGRALTVGGGQWVVHEWLSVFLVGTVSFDFFQESDDHSLLEQLNRLRQGLKFAFKEVSGDAISDHKLMDQLA
jgi:hypothetical protein